MSQTTTSSARILITGASGCVGQYTASWLLENSDAELLLWLRDPSKLGAIPPDHPRIQLLVGDLREADRFASELASVHRVIHTATAWGDPERAQQVNVVAVKRMLSLLNPSLIEQITYFSTASILDRHLQPLTEGLAEASKWLWLARFLRADASFHFIHAADIAAICGHLATHPHQRNREPGQGAVRRIVMGQKAISVNEAVASLCRWRGIRRTPGIPLWPWLIETLIRVLPIEVNAWDRFSIRQRHFIHEPVTQPERFGEKSHAADLEAVLQDSGLPRRRSP